MRILVHDYGGYAFALQLSRALARRGHTVCHAYCASLRTTPPGVQQEAEPTHSGLTVRGLDLGAPLEKYAYVRRWRQERAYGHLIAAEAERFGPDVVLSGNTPLDAQKRLLAACQAHGVPFVFWLQDLLGVAAHRLLRHKLSLLGEGVGRYYLGLERALLRRSDAVVLITDDFRPLMQAYGIAETALHLIENWGPLGEVPARPKANAWAAAHGLADKTCLLYAGTMGMKHNPDLVLQLALHLREDSTTRVVVVSQGMGADWLRQKMAEHGLDNLVLLGFQPLDALPDVLATADVLLAVLEPDASVFSVPSKVLTYLCAARPVLLAVPPENLAARIVGRIEAGRIVPPTAPQAFIEAAAHLLADPEAREAMGRNARAYAEQTFAIDTIADDFEHVFEGLRALNQPAKTP